MAKLHTRPTNSCNARIQPNIDNACHLCVGNVLNTMHLFWPVKLRGLDATAPSTKPKEAVIFIGLKKSEELES